MADDKEKRDYRDCDRINVHEEYEVRYWAKEFGVTPEKLKEAVDRVGVIVTNVRKALLIAIGRIGHFGKSRHHPICDLALFRFVAVKSPNRAFRPGRTAARSQRARGR
jgi:hypothetical protein